MAEPDLLGALRAGRKKNLGCGGVRILLEEMVLDLPDIVDAEPVGELDLVERILIEPQLGSFVPGLRQLVLVKNPEFHGVLPTQVRPSPSPTGISLATLAGRRPG